VIVCLGWGSLIWNPGVLPIAKDWFCDGPLLPIEFARVSNDGRLTLVVTAGAPTLPVLWSSLGVHSLESAANALAARENIKPENVRYSIGAWSRTQRSRHSEVDVIAQWASQRNVDAVVWTALKPGFPESRGVLPTVDQAVAHLRGLEGQARASAEEYVRRTPPQIRTPFRMAIERELGWTPLRGTGVND
jgi:hypothetical protein